MPRNITGSARKALAYLLIGSAIAAGTAPAANAQPAPTAAPAPVLAAEDALFGQAPRITEDELAATTGRENNLWMSASANNHAVVSDNHVGDNNVTGNVNVTDSAFQNVSGISMVNFNTGNNSSINAAMSVNLHINYAAPAAP